MADGKITIDTAVDSSGAVKGVNNLENQIKAPLKRIAGLVAVAFSVKAISNFAKESTELYKTQMLQETKLATVMKQRMGSTDKGIQAIKDFASEQQKLGIIGDEVQLAGAQQVATFLNQESSIKKLIPAMNNLMAQQNGFNSTTESAKNIGNLFGKVMQGNVSALSRVGITFTEAQKKVLKYGNEEERASMLAQVINDNVGKMNEALANTPLGRQQQLANTLGDIKENFGKAFTNLKSLFLPALNKLASVVNNVSLSFIGLSQALADVFGIDISNASTSIDNTSSGAEDLSSSIDDVANSTDKATKSAKKGARAFDELVTIQSKDKSSGSGTTTSVSSASSGAIDTANNKLNNTNKKLNKTIKNLKSILNYIKKLIEPLSEFAMSEEGFPRFFDITKKLANNIKWTALKKNIKTLSGALTTIAELGWTNLMNFYDSFLVPMITWAANDAFPLFVDNLKTLVDKFKKSTAINNLNDLYKILAKFTKKIGTGLIKFFNSLSQIAMDYILSLDWKSFNDALDDLLGIISTVASNVGKGIIDFFKGLQPVATIITNTLINLLKGLFSALDWFINLPAVQGVIEGVGSAITGMLTTILAVQITTKAITGLKNFASTISSIATVGGSLNPAVLGFSALAGALTGLVFYIKENYKSGWAKDFTDGLEEMKAKSDGISTQIESIGTALETSLDSTDAEVSDLQALADKYFDLAKKTKLTKKEQEELKRIAGLLNDKLAPLGLSFDSTTGYINDNKKAVKQLIKEYEKQAKTTAYQQALTSYYQTQADALVGVKEAQEKVTEAVKTQKEKSDDLAKSGIYAGTPQFEKEMSQYAKAVTDANKQLETAKTKYNEATNSLNLLRTEMGLVDAKGLSSDIKTSGSEMKTTFESVEERAEKFRNNTEEYMKQSATNGLTAFSNELGKQKNLNAMEKAGETIGKAVKDGVDKSIGAFNYQTDWRFTASKTAVKNGNTNGSGELKLKYTPLATGGVLPANRPFLAMLGDQKNGTNIEAPLDTIVKAMQIALNNNSAGGNDIVINVDGDELFRVVQNKATDYSRRTGLEAFA